MTRRGTLAALSGAILIAGLLATSPTMARAAATGASNVLLVGTYHGVAGGYKSIQAAVDAAKPGDWILVGPGDYHERQDYTVPSWPSGGWISKPGTHLRGMDRNAVIVDGTKPTATTRCSGNAADQDLGPAGQGRNGIEGWGPGFTANNVPIEN